LLETSGARPGEKFRGLSLRERKEKLDHEA
jgi:hypothetical protein